MKIIFGVKTPLSMISVCGFVIMPIFTCRIIRKSLHPWTPNQEDVLINFSSQPFSEGEKLISPFLKDGNPVANHRYQCQIIVQAEVIGKYYQYFPQGRSRLPIATSFFRGAICQSKLPMMLNHYNFANFLEVLELSDYRCR